MQITIVGLGLIGGSLGLALRRSRLAKTIIGHDQDLDAAQRARRIGAIDRGERSLEAAVAAADLVIVATPVGAVPTVFAQIAPVLPVNCVVSDVSGTKKAVMDWADDLLPEHISFIGGHPMAGRETSGIDAADPDLFVNAVYCLSPSATAEPRAVDLAVSLVTAVGAKPLFIDPVEHDNLVAAVSHLPFVISSALVETLAESNAWPDLAKLAATGFRDVSRLASGDPVLHRDICRTNRDAVVRWLDAYIAKLGEMRQIILNDDDELVNLLRKAKQTRDSWLKQHGHIQPVASSACEQSKQALFGNIRLRGKRKG